MDWKKVTENWRVVILLKRRKDLEDTIKNLDPKALINYELERLSEEPNNENLKRG